MKQLSGNPSAIEDPGCKAEEVARFIKSQDEEIKIFLRRRGRS